MKRLKSLSQFLLLTALFVGQLAASDVPILAMVNRESFLATSSDTAGILANSGGATTVLLAQADIVPAPWLADVLKVLQVDANRRYDADLAIFEQAKKDWTFNAVHNREIGAAQTPFTTPFPERVVFVATSPSTFDQKSVRDPNLHAPVLPPPVPILPPAVLSTGAPADRDMQQQMLGMILSKLLAIEAALNKLTGR